jgi:protein-S-isoprenylcysteine O-methyltransferase Ste14
VVVYLLAVSSALSTLGFMVATGLSAVWRSLATSRAVDIVGVRGLVAPVASLVIAALGAAVLLPLFRSTPRLATTLFHLVPGVAAMLPFLVWRLLDEERCLARRLPGYADYQKQVRYRLVPFVW